MNSICCLWIVCLLNNLLKKVFLNYEKKVSQILTINNENLVMNDAKKQIFFENLTLNR